MPTALVTGATAGIGHAFVRALAARGDDLVLVARDTARLEQVAAALRREHGVTVEALPADLADRTAVDRVAARLADPARPVDLLVNNAGFGLRRAFLVEDVAESLRMLEVMCAAVVALSHAAARAMTARGSGAVVTVSSIAGWSTMGVYAAAKAFATTFTEALSGELRGTGVTATALCPGFVRTEFHQRAGMRMGGLPRWAWLDADAVVARCLADVGRGRVVSVPGRGYAVAAGLLRVLPRPLVRTLSDRVATRRRGARGGRRAARRGAARPGGAR